MFISTLKFDTFSCFFFRMLSPETVTRARRSSLRLARDPICPEVSKQPFKTLLETSGGGRLNRGQTEADGAELNAATLRLITWNTKGGSLTVDLLFDWFGIICMINDNFLFLFAKQTNPNQSNRRSTVQWYFPLKYSLLIYTSNFRARFCNELVNFRV